MPEKKLNTTLTQYKWHGILFITIIVPIVFILIFDNPYCRTLPFISLGFVSTALIAFTVWTGCEIIEKQFNKWLPWKKQPARRALLQLAGTSVFAFLVSVFAAWITPEKFLEKSDQLATTILISVVITLLVNLAGIGHYFFHEWKISIQENEKLKQEQLETQFSSLKNQVNPHFLFNCLNTLTGLIEEKPTVAVNFVQNMASVYRGLLVQNQEQLNSIADEVKFLEAFLYLNKMRFEEGLNYEIRISEETKSRKIVNLCLQLLVENAIKHNIISISKPLFIQILVESDYLVIKNNLQKKVGVEGTGTGLKNITERCRLVMPDKPVIIEETTDLFQVKIPMI